MMLHVGLSDDALRALFGRLTLEEKCLLLTGRDAWALHPLPSIGLRSMVMSDGPVGVRGAAWDERSPSLNLPSPTAMAASWSREVVRRAGEALGSEARRKEVDVLLAPTINLHRTPYGGRHFEAFSEDPWLTGALAAAYVEGVQSFGVGATVKHYVANDSETDRFTVDVRVDDRALRELYLLAFEEPVVSARSWVVMSAYNSVNGATASENPLLTSPLNDEWCFDGVVVSDWTAVRSIESARHPQDLAMPGPDSPWSAGLVDAVRAGDVDEADIDRKVMRLLRLAARVGALDSVTTKYPAPLEDATARDIARRTAVEGMVLLQNHGALPMQAATRIAVIGEGAREARTQGGGSATVIPAAVVSPLDGVRERWPDAEVSWARGVVVQSGLADIPVERLRAADGTAGIDVRYIDELGRELAVETRRASGIVSFDAEALASRSAVVEMSFRYRPETVRDQLTRFGVAGLADFIVDADGREVTRGALRTGEGDDPAAAVLSPPFTSFDLPIEGESVAVVVRFMPVAGEMSGAMALRLGLPPSDEDPETLIAEAVQHVTAADVAVVVVSTSPEVESEGFDRTTLALPGDQDALVRAVMAANPRTIVVVNSGAPVTLPWRDDAAAILAVWFPGQEFGHALADVLSGDVEPGGRLPVSWPSDEESLPVSDVTPTAGRLVYSEGIHIGYRAWLRDGVDPAYPFGHGLGYTSHELVSLEVPAELAVGETRQARVVVKNTGARPGKAVVQLYAERIGGSVVDRPARWLVGFATASVEAGATAEVAIDIDWRRLAHWQDEWMLEPGSYCIRAGWSVEDLPLEARVEVR